MLLYFQKHRFLFFSLLLLLGFWLLESLIHQHVFDEGVSFEIIPSDPNELWMRLIICVLILCVGIVADKYIFSLNKIQMEKLRTLKATMYNVHDIAGNALSQISLLSEGDENVNKIISEAMKNLNEISELKEVVEEKNSQGVRNIKVTQSQDKD